MNGHRFDDLTRSFGAAATSRRTLLRTVAVGAIAALLPVTQRDVVAQATCDAPLRECGGTCVNPSSDPVHCGACGTACGEGESCQAGACSGATPCDGCGVADVCTDFATNDEHCGTCGNACPADRACRGGQCAPLATDVTSKPGASPGANDQSTCRVGPRIGYARVIPDGTPGASLVPSIEATPPTARAVLPSLAENQLPTGESASEAVVIAIIDTVEQVSACVSPISPGIVPATGVPDFVATPVGTPAAGLPVADLGVEPVLALYSDDYFRRPGVVTTGGIAYWAPVSPGPFTIRAVRVLSDGRIGAMVEGAGAPVFLVMTEADAAYLIDEVVMVSPLAGTPSP